MNHSNDKLTTETKKKEKLQDIQKLDKIYKQIKETNFQNQQLYSLKNKIEDLLEKEITNQIRQSNISHN